MTDKQRPHSEELVEGVAAVIYGAQVQEARKVIADRKVDANHFPVLFKRLISETEIARIHIFFSYLDDQIRERIIDNLVHLSTETAKERLFGLSGPLATFHTRTLMAHHLGWLSPDLKRRLDSLRKIRNEFGHAAYRVTSSDPSIAALWRSLDRDFTAVLNNVRKLISSRLPQIDMFTADDMPEERRQICQLAFLAHDAILELLVAPVANGFRVSMRDVTGTWDDSPEPVKHLSKKFASACYHCFAKYPVADPKP